MRYLSLFRAGWHLPSRFARNRRFPSPPIDAAISAADSRPARSSPPASDTMMQDAGARIEPKQAWRQGTILFDLIFSHSRLMTPLAFDCLYFVVILFRRRGVISPKRWLAFFLSHSIATQRATALEIRRTSRTGRVRLDRDSTGGGLLSFVSAITIAVQLQ